MEFYSFANGRAVVHARGRCAGDHCAIHNPSMHGMIEEPMILRTDRGVPLIERLCVHGVGHPDPDSVAFLDAHEQPGFDVHGCDGCCGKLRREEAAD